MPAKGQESMDQTPATAVDTWAKHLQPGERLLWQAIASPTLRRAEISRRRWAAVLICLATTALAAAFGYKLYETFLPGAAGSGLAVGIAAPLYFILALTFVAVALAQLCRLNPRLSPAIRYAATSTRLIALDAKGGLVGQVDVQDIAGFIVTGRRRAPDLVVIRRHDDPNVHVFSIEHIERPLEAKAIIEEEFLEPALTESHHEQAD